MRGPPRNLAPERLDAPWHEPSVLEASLAHIAGVNRWLGGRRALRLALAARLGRELRLLDVGTGSADLPLALARHAAQDGGRLAVVATDRHPQMLAIAARAVAGTPAIRLTGADALALPFAPNSFDVVVLSLVLHHLADEPAEHALREAARVAPLVIVNELHRTSGNYLGARFLAQTWWRDNPLTSHDGPLSVQRAYRPAELRTLAQAAGLQVIELRRRWFYRLVLVAARAAGTAQIVPAGSVSTK